ncbi:MAG: hypothetical protein WCO00_12340 [Rhodospirillaceae bacterium]
MTLFPRRLRQVLRLPLMVLAALVMLFEDFVWSRVTVLVTVIARLRLVARLEAWVLTRSRHTTLALFAVPILCLIPFKLFALWLIASGHLITGVLVIIAAKVTGTAISARLFMIAKPKLMTFETFVRVYGAVLRFNAWAHGLIDSLGVLAAIRTVRSAVRAAAAAVRTRVRRWFAAQ